MRVSTIITTRERPSLLHRALRSVSAQSHPELEIIVVDDGSSVSAAAEMAPIIGSLGTRAALHTLPRVPGGHGPSFARNHGAALASGDLLAFLDDDDMWIDSDYIARATRLCEPIGGTDLVYANQEAVRPDGSRVEGVVWIEDLADLVRGTNPPRADGTFLVTHAELLRSRGFCHLNATVVRRQFFQDLGGFDVLLRYEEDRDFHLRAIDAARIIVHDPATVSRHHVPERDSASTRGRPDERTLDQLRVLDKAILNAARPEIRAYARQYKAYAMKDLAQRRAKSGDHETAWFYAREALGIAWNPKWLAYTAWLGLKSKRTST